ncbi:UvrD-helicase domain-containing protein [Vibrio alginolyticus]|uniref:UvrD-helicase domain-containing protein n=1 Tax=Vibrio alginolyticus TaxID=663 RepID=UPI003747F466
MDQMSGAECPLHTLDRTEQPQPTPLEPMTFPLHGARLIEASAGTGKTFTIAGLYLRLLLGHGSAETSRTAYGRPNSGCNLYRSGNCGITRSYQGKNP